MRSLSLLLTLVLSLCTLGAASAQEDVPTGRIAFTSDRTGVYQIYVANADGSELEQITDGPFDAFLPLWSPDGEQMLYTESTSAADLSERPTLRLMLNHLDGSEPIELARDPEDGFLMNPARYLHWSPDGQKIVYGIFTDNADGRHVRFYVHPLDGSEPVEVASPEARTEIALAQFFDNDTLFLNVPFHLYRTNLDGSEPELLPATGAPALLSPDGQQIVTVDGGDLRLYDGDGENPVLVVEEMPGPVDGVVVAFAYELAWSPDREWVSGSVYLLTPLSLDSTPEPTPETPLPEQALFTARTDGSAYTSFVAADLVLSWSPDSRYIAYTLQQEGETRVVIAHPDGSEARALDVEGNSAQPAWQP